MNTFFEYSKTILYISHLDISLYGILVASYTQIILRLRSTLWLCDMRVAPYIWCRHLLHGCDYNIGCICSPGRPGYSSWLTACGAHKAFSSQRLVLKKAPKRWHIFDLTRCNMCTERIKSDQINNFEKNWWNSPENYFMIMYCLFDICEICIDKILKTRFCDDGKTFFWEFSSNGNSKTFGLPKNTVLDAHQLMTESYVQYIDIFIWVIWPYLQCEDLEACLQPPGFCYQFVATAGSSRCHDLQATSSTYRPPSCYPLQELHSMEGIAQRVTIKCKLIYYCTEVKHIDKVCVVRGGCRIFYWCLGGFDHGPGRVNHGRVKNKQWENWFLTFVSQP